MSAITAAQNIRILGASGAAVSCPADTSEDTLATVTVPAGAMGINGILRIWSLWTVTNSANNKTIRIHFPGAGNAYLNTTITTVASYSDCRLIWNRNSASSQVGNGGTQFGTISGALLTDTTNTANAQTLTFTGQKASAGETLTLESYLVELILP